MNEQEIARRIVHRLRGFALPVTDEDRAVLERYNVRATVQEGGAIVMFDAPESTLEGAYDRILDCLQRQHGAIRSVLWLPNCEGIPDEQ